MSVRERPAPASSPDAAIRDPDRRERLQTIITALGDTEVGRELGLSRLANLEDFRASIPLRTPREHAVGVTARLGFGLDELDDEALTAASKERACVCTAWRQQPAQTKPQRIALLLARADDPRVERMRLDDLRAFGGEDVELLHIDVLPAKLDKLIARLASFAPDTLVLPSLATCAWLEQHLRAPLERRLPSLRQLFVEHDLDERVRTRLPLVNTGWFHPAGRIGLPTQRRPSNAFRLATRSTLIELLPHGDPEVDPRQRTTERTTWPEAAILGERYELVLSSALGFLRYRSGLHVRVVGFAPSQGSSLTDGRPLPCPRVVRLPPPPADAALEGVTMAGAWLTASVRQAFFPEDPALVAADIAPDPDAIDASGRTSRSGLDPFTDTELGASRAGSRHRGPKPRSFVIRLEVQGQSAANFPGQISDRIDRDLCRRSAAYAWLRERDELWEPRVVIARPGTAREGREDQLRRLDGAVARPVVRLVS